MNKYQKQAKAMRNSEVIMFANSNDKSGKLMVGLAWFGGISAALFSFLGIIGDPFFFAIAGLGILLIALCAPIAHRIKGLENAAIEEVFERGLEEQLRDRENLFAERHAERRSKLKILVAAIIGIALFLLIFRSCGGNYTRCPKCGDLYDSGSGGADYIDKYGECAKCDYND